MPIRAMTREDSVPIILLDPQIFPEEEPWGEREFNAHFNSSFCFVAYNEQTKAINGYVFANTLGKNIHISNIGVHPVDTRSGIGSQLMETVIKAAQAQLHQGGFITLQVRTTNSRAIHFYEKYGFHNTGPAVTSGFQMMRRPLSLSLNPAPYSVISPEASAPQDTSSIEQKSSPVFGVNDISRKDIRAVKQEIHRLRNSYSLFDLGKTAKADSIEQALKNALDGGTEDVRQDKTVRAALAKHRIFDFFGTKTATALINIEKSYSAAVITQVSIG